MPGLLSRILNEQRGWQAGWKLIFVDLDWFVSLLCLSFDRFFRRYFHSHVEYLVLRDLRFLG